MIVGTSLWFSVCIGMKITLKILLRYQGYMFEGRGKKTSLKTKIWAILLKGIHAWNPPHLYSFQHSLPSLPVPPLKDTVQRHLRTIRPIIDDESFERLKEDAKEFENGIGKKLQRYLKIKSWWANNYVSDW
jgi:carnitine O-palmitoyltransferase 1